MISRRLVVLGLGVALAGMPMLSAKTKKPRFAQLEDSETRNVASFTPYPFPARVFPAAGGTLTVQGDYAVIIFKTAPAAPYRVLGAISIAFDGQAYSDRDLALKTAAEVARRRGADGLYLKPVREGMFLNGWALAWAK